MRGNANLSLSRGQGTLRRKEDCGSDIRPAYRSQIISLPWSISRRTIAKKIRLCNGDPRGGDGHDSEGDGTFRSAMKLRNMLAEGEDLSPFIPEEAMAVFRREQDAGRVRDDRILEAALLSRLYLLRPEDFDTLPDADAGAGRRLYQALWQGRGLEETVRNSVSKRCTAARMRRMLLCAALGICADDTKEKPPYIRILAADKRGMELLHIVSKTSRIPLLGKAGDAKKLGTKAERVFRLTAQAHALFCQQFITIDDRNPNLDWQQGISFVENN